MGGLDFMEIETFRYIVITFHYIFITSSLHFHDISSHFDSISLPLIVFPLPFMVFHGIEIKQFHTNSLRESLFFAVFNVCEESICPNHPNPQIDEIGDLRNRWTLATPSKN